MDWHKCSECMPGQEYDAFYNKELGLSINDSGFIVIYNHGDDEPFICRGRLYNGKFVTQEWCNAFDMNRPDGEEECFDKFQKSYWDDEIVVTHWAHIFWPEDLLD